MIKLMDCGRFSLLQVVCFVAATCYACSGCRTRVQPDAQVADDLVVTIPQLQEVLEQKMAEVDRLMQAGTPLTAEAGTTSFNECLQAAADYVEANQSTSGAIAPHYLGKALSLTWDLRIELLARYPERVHDGQPCATLINLYAGPGRWAGPRYYLECLDR